MRGEPRVCAARGDGVRSVGGDVWALRLGITADPETGAHIHPTLPLSVRPKGCVDVLSEKCDERLSLRERERPLRTLARYPSEHSLQIP